MTDFNVLCQTLSGGLNALERERQRSLALLWKWAAGLLLLSAVVGMALRVRSGHWGGGVLVGFLALIVWALIASMQSQRFVAAYKAEVLPALVQALGPQLRYYPGCCLGPEEFEACGLFRSPDRYKGDDLVAGTLGQTELRFSLVHAEEKYEVAYTETDTDSDGNTTSRTVYRTEYRDIFRGLLFSADCNKHFAGCTYVVAGGSGFLSRMRRDHVRLESPEFGRAFTVYASDQVEARYLLSPSLIERILELRRRAECDVQLSFVGSRLYLAMPMSLQAFTPSFWRRSDDLGQVAGWYGTLGFITGMVDDLNLNTRIWSKRPSSLTG